MKKLNILLVEDDTDDAELLRDALMENNIDFDMVVLTEGDKVMPYLAESGDHPDIIIMDLNLPKVHGRELLVMIRSSSTLERIPIVVFSTSSSPHDVNFAQDNGADKFITKPSTVNGFNSAVEMIISIAMKL